MVLDVLLVAPSNSVVLPKVVLLVHTNVSVPADTASSTFYVTVALSSLAKVYQYKKKFKTQVPELAPTAIYSIYISDPIFLTISYICVITNLKALLVATIVVEATIYVNRLKPS